MDPKLQQSEGYLTFRTWLAVAATYLGTLVLIAYPLGFATFWVQVWREYTYDAATALYAASLVPASVVVAKSFTVLFSALIIIGGVSAMVAQSVLSYRGAIMLSEKMGDELPKISSLRLLVLSEKGRISYLLVGLFVAVTTPYALWLVSLEDRADVFYYACAVLVASGGALIGTNLLFRNLEELPDRSIIYGQAIPLMAASALIASLFLVPLMPSNLPSVRFSEGTIEEATLISHSEGYWYVVDTPETGVLAMPDTAVGTATILEASESTP